MSPLHNSLSQSHQHVIGLRETNSYPAGTFSVVCFDDEESARSKESPSSLVSPVLIFDKSSSSPKHTFTSDLSQIELPSEDVIVTQDETNTKAETLCKSAPLSEKEGQRQLNYPKRGRCSLNLTTTNIQLFQHLLYCPMALLDMKVPNHYPGGVPRVPPLQHSLLVSINIHLLRLLLIPYISVTYGYS
ncbi:hypothetical protein GEMRC1_013392 [Eukaryota sp. GEM-RC1]